LFAFAILLLAISGARAQDVKASLTLDSASYAIGDWMNAVLSVDAPHGWALVLPIDSADAVQATIVSPGSEERRVDGTRDRILKNYVLTCFDTGRMAVVLKVRYRVPGDTTIHFAATPPVSVTIRSIPVDTSKAYLDIKDVVDVPLTLWEILAYIGLMLLVLAVLWYALRRYLRQPVEEPPVIVRTYVQPAYDAALARLQALEKDRLWERGEHKAYQSALTEIVREYIERRYHVPALEQVTSEIVRGVAMMGVEPAEVVKLEQMLRIADMAKFATYTPVPQEHVLGLRIAYEFLEHTKPAVPEEAEVIEEVVPTSASGEAAGQSGEAPTEEAAGAAEGERRDV
jgi:hypothetical protein